MRHGSWKSKQRSRLLRPTIHITEPILPPETLDASCTNAVASPEAHRFETTGRLARLADCVYTGTSRNSTEFHPGTRSRSFRRRRRARRGGVKLPELFAGLKVERVEASVTGADIDAPSGSDW